MAAHRDQNSRAGGENADLHPKNRQSAAQERRGRCEISLPAARSRTAGLSQPRATTGLGLPKEQVDKAEETLLRLFDKAEDELSQHEWLVGDQFSLAELPGCRCTSRSSASTSRSIATRMSARGRK